MCDRALLIIVSYVAASLKRDRLAQIGRIGFKNTGQKVLIPRKYLTQITHCLSAIRIEIGRHAIRLNSQRIGNVKRAVKMIFKVR